MRKKAGPFKKQKTAPAKTPNPFVKDVIGGARELKKSVQQGGFKGGVKAIGEGVKNMFADIPKPSSGVSPRMRQKTKQRPLKMKKTMPAKTIRSTTKKMPATIGKKRMLKSSTGTMYSN